MLSNEHHLHHFDHAHKTRDVNTSHTMRGLNPPISGLAEGKPSKLELMRADYQKKLLKQKEEKLIQIYEDNQKKVMMRMTRDESANVQNGATRTGGVRSVWGHLNGRQGIETNGVSSADNHYRQTKALSVPKEMPSRRDAVSTLKMLKLSAGRDRAQPLAPIRRTQDTHDAPSNLRSGIPQRLPLSANEFGDGNPFLGRPRLVKHKPLPPTSNFMIENKNNGCASDLKDMQSPLNENKLVLRRMSQAPRQLQQRSAPADRSHLDPQGERLPPRGQEKLTDFQKWQEEQSQARDDRLKKLNGAMFLNSDSDGVWGLPDNESEKDFESAVVTNDVNQDGTDLFNPSDDNDEIKVKERELLEKIAHRQRELDKIKQEREESEAQEKLEEERQKKKEAAERAKQRKLDEDRRKEEAKRMKQEDNEIRLELQKKDKQRKDEEKRKKENERRMKEEDRKRQQEEQTVSTRQFENELKISKQPDRLPSNNSDNRNNRPVSGKDSPPTSSRSSKNVPKISRDPQPSKSKMDSADLDSRRLSLSDAHVYEQAAASYDAQVLLGDLASCNLCGRSFVKDRLSKHQEACVKANKHRKEFDSAKKRVEGTELAKYAGKSKRPEPPKKKSNWRAKHEDFIQSLRYAKKVTKCEQEGGDYTNITPPPTSKNPDYVPCPHCGRTFNESAAERHIPRCQSLKTRPPPTNTRRK